MQGISEAFLLPVLALIMAQFPFEIVGFHSDNGSEYINAKVAKLLNKLRIEQTKSRARHSNDNALAESKNGSVVRKHMGYSHIPQQYAEPINHFYQQHFNPWLNLHRPSMFATEIVSPKGKIVKRYDHKDVKTPLECLVLLNKQGLVSFKTSATLTALLIQSNQMTDLMAAQQMQHAKSVLFKSFANAKKRQTQERTALPSKYFSTHRRRALRIRFQQPINLTYNHLNYTSFRLLPGLENTVSVRLGGTVNWVLNLRGFPSSE